MDQATQIALTKRLFKHLADNTTDVGEAIMKNPVSAYASPQRLALEKQKLFLREPLLIALSCHIPEPGDYLTDDNADLPAGGADGEVRAFVNACRHRGARLVEGAGRVRKHLTCPYHAWSYDSQGAFVHAPSKEHFEGFDFAGCRLKRLPCAERDGLIWVRADVNAGETGIDI
jgi:phenylpropionate dioxygenase-like ring-hydroxylating dioxygenase large terminal subunit